jgi:hypothetical protein
MRRLPPILLAFLVALGCLFGCLPAERHYTIDYYQHTAAESSARPRTVGAGTLVNRAIIQAGTSGTVTVAAGTYVQYCDSFGTSAGTLVVTPCGPQIGTCSAQPTITLPANVSYRYSPTGAPNSVADGSTLVYTGTAAYTCTEWQYQP